MRAALAMAGLAMLAACASVERGAPARPSRDQISAFQLEGRIAVRRGEESFSAHLDWQHTAATDEIIVSGPLGQGYAQLSADSSGARLLTGDHKELAAPDLDALSGKVFGATLPVSGMARWVLAQSTHGSAATMDTLGRLSGLTDQGWVIEYQRYESDAPDALPVLLRAQREDIELRLKIDTWTVR